MTELSDQPFGKVEDVIKKGDPIEAKVIKLDPEHKKIALSIKDHLIDTNEVNRDDIVLGEAKEEIDIDYNGGDEIEIGFNPRYLIDVLKSLTEEEIIFEVNDSTKPGVVRRGEEYTYVVLPMQLTT